MLLLFKLFKCLPIVKKYTWEGRERLMVSNLQCMTTNRLCECVVIVGDKALKRVTKNEEGDYV